MAELYYVRSVAKSEGSAAVPSGWTSRCNGGNIVETVRDRSSESNLVDLHFFPPAKMPPLSSRSRPSSRGYGSKGGRPPSRGGYRSRDASGGSRSLRSHRSRPSTASARGSPSPKSRSRPSTARSGGGGGGVSKPKPKPHQGLQHRFLLSVGCDVPARQNFAEHFCTLSVLALHSSLARNRRWTRARKWARPAPQERSEAPSRCRMTWASRRKAALLRTLPVLRGKGRCSGGVPCTHGGFLIPFAECFLRFPDRSSSRRSRRTPRSAARTPHGCPAARSTRTPSSKGRTPSGRGSRGPRESFAATRSTRTACACRSARSSTA